MSDAPMWVTYVQVGSWVFGSIGVVSTASLALWGARQNRKWQRSRAAIEALDAIEDDQLAADAMRMLDWSGLDYKCGDVTYTVTYAVVESSLRVVNTSFDLEEEIFVRNCFDHLFYHFERIKHLIDIDLIDLDDVRFPLTYVSKDILNHKLVFHEFLTRYHYGNAHALIALLMPGCWDELTAKGIAN